MKWLSTLLELLPKPIPTGKNKSLWRRADSVKNLATPDQAAAFGKAAELLAEGRAARLAGRISEALVKEHRGEWTLHKVIKDLEQDGIVLDLDKLMSSWETSTMPHPLMVREWAALVYTPTGPIKF